MLLGCTGWFFCASAVCGWAGSMRGLILGRALQGVAGGGCVQLVCSFSSVVGRQVLIVGRLLLLLVICLG